MAEELQPQGQLVVQDARYVDLLDATRMQQAFEVAKQIAQSQLIPRQYQNKPADVVVATIRARRLGVDPFSFMEASFVLRGKVGYEGKLMIALINNSGVFKGPIRFRYEGDNKANRACTAYAHLRTPDGDDTTHGLVEQRVTYQMAVGNRWNLPKATYDNSGNKTGEMPSQWETNTDLMLAYRSATYLGRLYCPNVILGMQSVEEIADADFTVVDAPAPKKLFGDRPPAPAVSVSEPVAQPQEPPPPPAPAEPPRTPDPAPAKTGKPKKEKAPAPSEDSPPAPDAPAPPAPSAGPAAEEPPLTPAEVERRRIVARLKSYTADPSKVAEFLNRGTQKVYLQPGQTLDDLSLESAQYIETKWALFTKRYSAWLDDEKAKGTKPPLASASSTLLASAK